MPVEQALSQTDHFPISFEHDQGATKMAGVDYFPYL